MNTFIQRLDGTIYDLQSLGIITRDFVISSPSYRHTTEETEGRHGLLDMGSVYGAREINISFVAKATDKEDYALMRDEIFQLFRSNESFYVIESRNPAKRWLVKLGGSFALDQQRIFGFFDINLIAYSGLAESIGTTLDPFTFDAELWQIGQGLTTEDVQYIHHATSFSVYNAGLPIDPRYMPLKITYKGASTNLKIKNVTTGTEWAYTGDSNEGDTILLDGIRSTKNGLSIFRDTNKKLITLDTGWNDFILTGTSGAFEISFEHRFYYL